MSIPEKILTETQYLPPIEYFCLLDKVKTLTIEAQEHFIKQTYRNRCYILGANSVIPLIIPIKHKNKKEPIEKLEIDYRQKWQNLHTRAIQSAYGKSPFFIHYSEIFLEEINSNSKYLIDLNEKLLTICLEILGIRLDINRTKKYVASAISADKGYLRDIITPKVSYKERNIYYPVPYYQMFGKTFDSNLSILDLIFCEGPNALSIIRQSVKE